MQQLINCDFNALKLKKLLYGYGGCCETTSIFF